MSCSLTHEQIAWRVAQDIFDGAYVNLGIGMPELVARFLPPGREAVFHSENGVLGMGPPPAEDAVDWDLINAGKKPVTLVRGGCFFDHADSFAMIRGGHIDICILGAYEVSERGDLANWATGDTETAPAVGGAMDLAVGARQVFVMMNHTTRDGRPKIVKECSLPLTARGVVRTIYTELAVIDIRDDGLQVREVAPGMTMEALQSVTGARLIPPDPWREISVPPIELARGAAGSARR